MARNLLLRLLDAVPTVLLVLTLVFIAMRILPGDPAIAALGDFATAEKLAALRERMGPNDPLIVHFFDFPSGTTLGFGEWLMTGQDVLGLILYNLPYTIELTLASLFLGIILGVPLGVMAARHRNGHRNNAALLARRLRDPGPARARTPSGQRGALVPRRT